MGTLGYNILMAIKYLAGERLVGTAAERAGITATYWYEQPLQANSLVLSTDTAWYWTIIAMKNTTGSAHSTNQLVVYLDKVGSPTATTRARIYAADNSVLATSTDTVLSSALTAEALGSNVEFKFNFATTTVPINGFVGVYTTDTDSDSNFVNVAVQQDPAVSGVPTHGIGGVSPAATTWSSSYTSATFTCKVGLANLNLPKGAIFEESDTGKHYMWDGTSTWNEMT